METLKPNMVSPTKDSVESPKTVVDTDIEGLDQEYIDKRFITISLVHNYSDFRKANMKVLGQKKEVIGSSIQSSRILSSNAGEVEAYFPALIGLSPNNPDFVSRVKAWLNNIQFIVNNNDVRLDISFVYKTKRDYIEYKKKEDAIDEKYSKIDRTNLSIIRESAEARAKELNTLESTKYKVGYPVNLEQYLMYRHCLLYRSVAKDTALINSDPTLRFYIKDENKELEKQKKLTKDRIDAMRNFVELNASEQKFNSVYIMIISSRSEDLSSALLKDRNERTAIVMDFVNANPSKFNKLIKDPNISTKAFIERLIVRGELVRAEYNQQISTADGMFIGSNMNEAVAFFNNPSNKEVRSAYETKLKMF